MMMMGDSLFYPHKEMDGRGIIISHDEEENAFFHPKLRSLFVISTLLCYINNDFEARVGVLRHQFYSLSLILCNVIIVLSEFVFLGADFTCEHKCSLVKNVLYT